MVENKHLTATKKGPLSSEINRAASLTCIKHEPLIELFLRTRADSSGHHKLTAEPPAAGGVVP